MIDQISQTPAEWAAVKAAAEAHGVTANALVGLAAEKFLARLESQFPPVSRNDGQKAEGQAARA